MKKIRIILVFIVCFAANVFSQNVFTLSGKVKDDVSGEELIGVSVSAETVDNKTIVAGTVTNMNGAYSFNLKQGNYIIVFSSLGYEAYKQKVNLTENKRLNIQLSVAQTALKEVEISGRRADANVTDLSMSSVRIPMIAIKKMPALLGEVDVIKSIQLLPGVQAAAEGASGFSVRGGGADQNLILFDDAVIYNASHLMGFFSVFNNEVVEDATLYKGDIPATYGGRLSSVLDVTTRQPNMQKFKGSGGIGLISSRLSFETPVVKDKLSVMVSGRRTYADLFLPLAPDEDIRNNTLYFYDLNARIDYKINDNNKAFVSAYFGRDKFANDIAGMRFENAAITARWNHIFSKTLFLNTSLIFSQYAYGMDAGINDIGIEWISKIQDLSAKFDLVKLLNTKNTLRFGASSTHHYFMPAEISNTGQSDILNDTLLSPKNAWEHVAYISNEQKITDGRLSVKYGLRASLFQNVSNDAYFNSEINRRLGGFTDYYALEPRAGLVWVIPAINSSVKVAYSHTVQNAILGSNSNGGMPLDVWFPVNPNIKPEYSNQYTLGFFKNLFDNKLETSIEAYYKTIDNLVDFKDNASLIGNAYIETEILQGKGRSYGVEFLVRKHVGDLSGWISYTWSRSFRTIDGISFGKEYRSPFDRPHNFVAVLSYDVSRRVNVSANWIYNTGQPVTYPSGKMVYGNKLVPIYFGNRNTFRYPDYHRLDLSVTIKSKQHSWLPWRGEWNFSVYNAYARKNVWAVVFVQDKENANSLQTKMVYLFSVVPSITYNFYF